MPLLSDLPISREVLLVVLDVERSRRCLDIDCRGVADVFAVTCSRFGGEKNLERNAMVVAVF